MLKLVYGDVVVTMKTVYKWFERFHNGCEWRQSRSNIKVMLIVFFDLD